MPPPAATKPSRASTDDWSRLPLPARPMTAIAEGLAAADADDEDPTGSEQRRQPELARAIPAENKAPIENEFDGSFDDNADDDAVRISRATQIMQGVARQVSLDPDDGMEL